MPEADKVMGNSNSNNDLSLSFVSRVSFRDVPNGAEFDEKVLDGLGLTPRDFTRPSSDPKVQ